MTHKPPVPPANRSPHESGHDQNRSDAGQNKIPENLREQDRQGNIHQNTHNQGYQQDR
jgi:hypothetical protein